MINTRKLLSDAKFHEAYSRYDHEYSKYESWEESVARVMNMHREKYKHAMTPELSQLIDEAQALYELRYCLAAQRSLQFGGEKILTKHLRMYNCTSTYADRHEVFGEFLFALLCGCGVGVSIQGLHVDKLPHVNERRKQPKMHVISDDIEGWATAFDVLMSSYFDGGGKYPSFEGHRVYFDYKNIRPKGAPISGGFSAPGHVPLKTALDKIERLMDDVSSNTTKLSSINVYDIMCHAADAVISGGVRRSATIFLFDIHDEEMMNAKTGNWWNENPQRARSNNSAVCIRSEITREEFHKLIQSTKEYGEPGFVFADNVKQATNPCVEIGLLPYRESDNASGFEMCNLTEINGGKCTTADEFYKACRAAAIIGTLQAGYDEFPFMGEVTEEIVKREALIGVSITGFCDNPSVLFDEETLKEGAKIVKRMNKKVARLIGINQAARCTTVKPSGNASVLLGTSSGIHPEHSGRYFRNVRMMDDNEIVALIKESNPYMIEKSLEKEGEVIVSFPIEVYEETIKRNEMDAVDLLERVVLVQQSWIEYGTNKELCVDPMMRHSVSNTVSVAEDAWDETEECIWNNRHSLKAVSLLGMSGDTDYPQAPFQEVKTAIEIVEEYGDAAVFASGLIVGSLRGWGHLYSACHSALHGTDTTNDHEKTWIDRFGRFANNYFEGNMNKAAECLKHVDRLHRWNKIEQNFCHIDFTNLLTKDKVTAINTTAAAACSGGACEI